MADDTIQVRIVGDASSAETAARASADAVRNAAAVMKQGLADVQAISREAFSTLGMSAKSAASDVEQASTRSSAAVTKFKAAASDVNVSTGQMKFAMRDLSFQINDVATMFALGAPPMQIFASQGGQVIGALQMMTGEAKGLLGLLGGPWGMIVTSAAMVLVPLIGKLFDTGNAASTAATKVYGLRQALIDLKTVPMQALGELQKNVFSAEGKLNNARSVPMATGSGEAGRASADAANENRDRAIKQAQFELEQARRELDVAKAVQSKQEQTKPAAPVAQPVSTGGGRVSTRTAAAGRADNSARQAAREQAQADREAMQERIAVNRQEMDMAQEKARGEIELSRMTLQDKLADLDAEVRAGAKTNKQAAAQRADLNRQLATLDQQLETRIYAAKLKDLQTDQRNYKASEAEYRNYGRQIETLELQHLNRMAVLKAQADAKQRQQDRMLESESNRRMRGMASTWAQSLSRMATLQQGFMTTVKGLWDGIANVIGDIIAQILEKWIISQLVKIGLIKAEHASTVGAEASKAGAGGVASMAAAPFPLNLGAPAFGASMAAAASAFGALGFSAAGGYDVPALAGPGIDGRGGQIGVVHPREMILPADIADNLRGGGSDGESVVHIHAMDARSFERFAKQNSAAFGKSVKAYARQGGR